MVQEASSEESDLNEEPQKKIIKKKNQVSTPQQEPLVPDNPADYDHANDSTFSKSFEEIQDGELNMEEEEEDESLPSLIDEEEKLREENEKWDQYFGINKTVIPASSTTSPFHGFSTVSQEDSTNDVNEDLLLTTDYKDNTLQFYATEKVTIAPYSAQIMILDIINAPWFTPTFPLTSSSSRKKFNNIFVTSGMCPHPQVADGIYPIRYNQIQIVVRNGNQKSLTIGVRLGSKT